MSRIRLLTQYFVKSSLHDMFGGNGKSKIKTIGIVILMIFVIVCFSTPFTFIVSEGYDQLQPIGKESMILSFVILMSVIISFFFGIYTIMNIFYFSNDIEYLLPLPFKGEEIVFAKFAAVLVNMFIYSCMAVLPLIVYGVKLGAGINYYLFMIIVVIITPIMPMVLATFICIVLMRFTNLSKHKDAFKLVSGCLSLVFIVGINFLNQSSGEKESSAIIDMIGKGEDSIIGKISGIFITNKFSTLGLQHNESVSGLLNILIAVLISVTIYILFYIIAGKLYLKSVVGISESYSKRENVLKGKNKDKLICSSSPIKSIVKKDLKIIVRTPQFFMNCVAMLFYMPVIMGIGLISGGSIGGVAKLLDNSKCYGVVIAVIFIITTIFIANGGAATSAISREGKDFMVSKYIPINYKDQLHAKIISSLCINSITWLIILIMLLILKVDLFLLVISAIISMLTIISITLLGLFFDYKYPKLEWEDEKSVMKNNFVPLVIMLIMLLIGGIFVALSIILKEVIITFVLIIIVCLAIDYLVYNRLLVLAEKLYNDI